VGDNLSSSGSGIPEVPIRRPLQAEPRDEATEMLDKIAPKPGDSRLAGLEMSDGGVGPAGLSIGVSLTVASHAASARSVAAPARSVLRPRRPGPVSGAEPRTVLEEWTFSIQGRRGPGALVDVGRVHGPAGGGT